MKQQAEGSAQPVIQDFKWSIKDVLFAGTASLRPEKGVMIQTRSMGMDATQIAS